MSGASRSPFALRRDFVLLLRAARSLLKFRPTPFVRFVLILGIAFHIGFFVFLPVREAPDVRPVRERGFVQIYSSEGDGMGRLVDERSLLFDTEPLFLPTRWNTAAGFEIPSQDLDAVLFRPYPPVLSIEVETFAPSRLAGESIEADVFLTAPSQLTWGNYGARGDDVEVLPVKAGFLEVRASADGSLVAMRSLPDPLVAGLGELSGEPVVFQVLLAGDFPMAPPLLVQSSGNRDWDAAVRAYLLQAEWLAGVGQGYFQVLAGP